MGEYRLPHDGTAPAKARARADEELGSVLASERMEDCRLMVTELVSNAVLHGRPEPDGRVVFGIEREPGAVRVFVRDGGTHIDMNEPTFHTQVDGHYGLFLVDRMADRWGFSIDGDKGVWFEVDVA